MPFKSVPRLAAVQQSRRVLAGRQGPRPMHFPLTAARLRISVRGAALRYQLNGCVWTETEGGSMATRIPEGSSIRIVVEAVDATCAAVSSDPETAALESTWVALRDRADGQAKARSDADRALSRARARLGVCDARWDATVAAFGRAVVDVSGGRRDQAPYVRFFGKAAPSAVQTFGIQREIESARGWLVELGRNPNELLAQTWTPKLKAVTDELEMVFNQRNDCLRAIEPLQTAVLLLIEDVNRELNLLEGDLKKIFPTAPDRVASFLAATRHSRASSNEEPAPAPAPTTK
jgi:hypothetical protein